MLAVIFTSQRTSYQEGYDEFNDELEKLAVKIPGFIRQDSSRDKKGYGISISYWEDEESVKQFKQIPLHIDAQQKGKTHYYEWYEVKICEVQRQYTSKKEQS